MEFHVLCCYITFVLALFITRDASGIPRDGSVIALQANVRENDESWKSLEGVNTKENSEHIDNTEIKIPGRVSCQFEEATEDAVCQEHCLPKGYSYGICVSKTCSCI